MALFHNFREWGTTKKVIGCSSTVVFFATVLSASLCFLLPQCQVFSLNDSTKIIFHETKGPPWTVSRSEAAIQSPLSLVHIGRLVRFVKRCFLCTQSHTCGITAGRLNYTISNFMKLEIKDFVPCKIPAACIWDGVVYQCKDLVDFVSHLT